MSVHTRTPKPFTSVEDSGLVKGQSYRGGGRTVGRCGDGDLGSLEVFTSESSIKFVTPPCHQGHIYSHPKPQQS